MANNSVSHALSGSAKALPSGRFLHGLTNTERPAARAVPGESIEQFVTPAPPQKRDSKTMKSLAAESSPSFGRVLLATDFSSASRSAFYTALEVSSLVHGSLLVLHVFENSDAAGPESGGSLLEMQGLREKCALALDQLREQGGAAGVECKTMLQDGIASSSILEVLEEHRIDLAIIGTNAPHGFDRLVFGSTAESVLRKAKCPVLTVGPRVARDAPKANTGPIVFATDFEYSTIRAIRYAAYLSNQTSAPLHCVHVLPRTLEGGTQADVVPQIMAEALHQLATESGVMIEPPTCATTFGSEISYAVVDYARQHNARLIVLGVRQASLLASNVPEHITYRIITEASCPVLTMAYGSATTPIEAPRGECKRVPARNTHA